MSDAPVARSDEACDPKAHKSLRSHIGNIYLTMGALNAKLFPEWEHKWTLSAKAN